MRYPSFSILIALAIAKVAFGVLTPSQSLAAENKMQMGPEETCLISVIVRGAHGSILNRNIYLRDGSAHCNSKAPLGYCRLPWRNGTIAKTCEIIARY